jgi:hypothetical protein
LTGKAFSRVWGLRYLAQISRWHDRDKADLELTLPTAISFLIRDHHLAAQDAIPLLRLTDVVEMWDWGWADIFQSLIEAKAEAALFESALALYEANYPSGSYFRLDAVRSKLETAPPEVFARLKPRLDWLYQVATRRRAVARNSHNPASIDDGVVVTRKEPDEKEFATAAMTGIDPTEVAALESLVEQLNESDSRADVKRHAFEELRKRVAYGDRHRHIEAIVHTKNLDLFAKNALLQDIKNEWISDSPSQLEIFKAAGTVLVKMHAEELVGSRWGFNWELNKVAELSGLSRTELAITLVEAATFRELDASATTWINLASILSINADPGVSRQALERLMESGAARLADDVADGPWRSELDPGSEPLMSWRGWSGFVLARRALRTDGVLHML